MENIQYKLIKFNAEKHREYGAKYYQKVKDTDAYKQAIKKAQKNYYLRNAERLREKRRENYHRLKQLK
jgi:hypothetical protein